MIKTVSNIIKSLGVVFGDIGTSPIYTLTAAFLFIPITPDNVIGIVSLVVWTLIIVVSVQYTWLAMSIGSKEEGGTIVLKDTLIPLLKSRVSVGIASFLAFLGISFFIGDGVITPAISILSAVEGLNLIPGMRALPQELIIIIACLIAIGLFFFQKRGTETIGVAFGPLMLVWFFVIGFSGLLSIIKHPAILSALNPYHGIRFIISNGIVGFFVLSKIILCATGSEALYADMGHLGRRSIIQAWILVFVSLLCIYMGQGVFILQNPQAKNIFYEMIRDQSYIPYIPFLVLSIIATVIASQAMITGIFSIVYQCITTHIIPRFSIEYTSRILRSQIYIPSVNWFLMILVIIAMINFKYSINLANAYGLAASGTMTITALLLTWIFFKKKDVIKMPIAFVIVGINLLFLTSNIQKIPYGGYWSLITASVPLALILVYTAGQKKLYRALKPFSLARFLKKYRTLRPRLMHDGTAVFLSKSISTIPTYISHTMFTDTIIYEDNIIVTVITRDKAFGVTGEFKKDLAPRLRHFEISCGYQEIINIEKILMQANIDPKIIFYGMENIYTKNIIWKMFAFIKKITPSFVQFYKLPFYKLHGVVVPVKM